MIMTEEELEKAVMKFNRRIKTFKEEGLSDSEAFDLADQMLIRDTEDTKDDRRLCFECRSFSNNHCDLTRKLKHLTPQKFVLQRCEEFRIKGGK